VRHNIKGGQVAFSCPVCGAVVPMFRVEVTRYGFLGRRTAVVVDGDATDFVAHLWTHRHPGWDKTDISTVT
jgi:hypothetical protein